MILELMIQQIVNFPKNLLAKIIVQVLYLIFKQSNKKFWKRRNFP